MLGSNAFRMKLDSVHGKSLVHHAHDQPITGFRVDDNIRWDAGTFDDQRMITGGLERSIDAAKDSRSCVLYL